MASKKQQEVDSINKQRSISKSKSTNISPPIFDSSIGKSSITEVKKKTNEEALLVNQEKKNNNVEVDPKEDSISRTSSDESSDELVNQVKKKNNGEVDPKEDSISRTSSNESSDESSGKVNKKYKKYK